MKGDFLTYIGGSKSKYLKIGRRYRTTVHAPNAAGKIAVIAEDNKRIVTNSRYFSNIKPPIGLKPKWLSDEERLNEVIGAIIRYSYVKLKIPIEWIREYNEIIDITNCDNEQRVQK